MCINSLDKPTTYVEFEIKLINISESIIKSGCDVVALQQLPFQLHIKKITVKKNLCLKVSYY